MLIPPFLRALYQLGQAGLLGQSGLAQLVQLGQNEGFHNKMELMNRQAYGFRNFQNHRLRVQVLCS